MKVLLFLICTSAAFAQTLDLLVELGNPVALIFGHVAILRRSGNAAKRTGEQSGWGGNQKVFLSIVVILQLMAA